MVPLDADADAGATVGEVTVAGPAPSELVLLGQAVTATVVISAPAAMAGPAMRAARTAIGAGSARRARARKSISSDTKPLPSER